MRVRHPEWGTGTVVRTTHLPGGLFKDAIIQFDDMPKGVHSRVWPTQEPLYLVEEERHSPGDGL